MIVVGPVGDGPQRRPGREHPRLSEQRHEGDEPTVAAAVDPEARRVHRHLPDEPARGVHLIVQVAAPHVTVDRRAPRAPVPRTAAVVQVEDRVAARGEQLVEHVFAVVARPPLVDVLEIARAVDENHRRVVGRSGGPVQTRRHLHAVARRDRHDLGLDPAESAPFRRRALGDLPRRRAWLVALHVQLGRMIGRRLQDRERRSVRRDDHVLPTFSARQLDPPAPGHRQRVVVHLAPVSLVGLEEERPLVRRQRRALHLPIATRQRAWRSARGRHHVEMGIPRLFAGVIGRLPVPEPAGPGARAQKPVHAEPRVVVQVDDLAPRE